MVFPSWIADKWMAINNNDLGLDEARWTRMVTHGRPPAGKDDFKLNHLKDPLSKRFVAFPVCNDNTWVAVIIKPQFLTNLGALTLPTTVIYSCKSLVDKRSIERLQAKMVQFAKTIDPSRYNMLSYMGGEIKTQSMVTNFDTPFPAMTALVTCGAIWAESHQIDKRLVTVDDLIRIHFRFVLFIAEYSVYRVPRGSRKRRTPAGSDSPTPKKKD